MNTQSQNPQSGQVAVIILLLVVSLSVIGLSELGQTTEDVFISSRKSESTRVFNAAETGVEEALSDEGNFGTDSKIITVPDEEDGININVTTEPTTTLTTNIAEGETATVDLTGSGTVTIEWGSVTNCNAASLGFAIYSKDASDNVTVRYDYVEPYACNRGTDQFEPGETGSTLSNRYSLTTTSTDVLLRIISLYTSTDLFVAGANAPQAHTVRSEAETDVDEATTDDTVEQIVGLDRLAPAAPDYMNYALYSNGSITQQN